MAGISTSEITQGGGKMVTTTITKTYPDGKIERTVTVSDHDLFNDCSVSDMAELFKGALLALGYPDGAVSRHISVEGEE
jgi:hypothetical protein